MGVLLGSVYLDGFEVAARMGFGGQQRLAVHKLPGGGRVIDAMGPDDHVIAWHGILSGNNATDRARLLDAIRVTGGAVSLSWDVFSATVLVSDLKLEFQNSWWIPYQIACTVLVGTSLASSSTLDADILPSILADLGLASDIQGSGPALAAVTAAGNAPAGSQLYAAAVTALLSANASVAGSIQVAEANMDSDDIPSLVLAAGSLASFTAAAGYLGRASVNFTEAGF